MSKKVLNTVTTKYIRKSLKSTTQLSVITQNIDHANELIRSWNLQGGKNYSYEIVEQFLTPVENTPLLDNIVGQGSLAHWTTKDFILISL